MKTNISLVNTSQHIEYDSTNEERSRGELTSFERFIQFRASSSLKKRSLKQKNSDSFEKQDTDQISESLC